LVRVLFTLVCGGIGHKNILRRKGDPRVSPLLRPPLGLPPPPLSGGSPPSGRLACLRSLWGPGPPGGVPGPAVLRAHLLLSPQARSRLCPRSPVPFPGLGPTYRAFGGGIPPTPAAPPFPFARQPPPLGGPPGPYRRPACGLLWAVGWPPAFSGAGGLLPAPTRPGPPGFGASPPGPARRAPGPRAPHPLRWVTLRPTPHPPLLSLLDAPPPPFGPPLLPARRSTPPPHCGPLQGLSRGPPPGGCPGPFHPGPPAVRRPPPPIPDRPPGFHGAFRPGHPPSPLAAPHPPGFFPRPGVAPPPRTGPGPSFSRCRRPRFPSAGALLAFSFSGPNLLTPGALPRHPSRTRRGARFPFPGTVMAGPPAGTYVIRKTQGGLGFMASSVAHKPP